MVLWRTFVRRGQCRLLCSDVSFLSPQSQELFDVNCRFN